MLAVPEILVRLADAALPVIVDAWVKGAVVLAAAWGATRLMRRASAASRHLVWTAGFAGLIALPVLSLVVPAWRVPVPQALRPLVQRPAPEPAFASATPSPADVAVSIRTDTVVVLRSATVGVPVKVIIAPEAAATADADVVAVPGPIYAAAPEAVVFEPAQSAPPRNAPRGLWLLGYWLAGSLFILGGLLRGRWQVSRMGQRAQRVHAAPWIELAHGVADRLGIRRPITLLRSAAAGVPVTWGAVYPVVLLPGDADEWTAERKNAVLVHEMAHVTRFDVVTQLLAQLATALHWPNPLAWVALRHLRTERERACDDYVLSTGATASAYAGDLLEIVRSLGSADRPALAALAMAHRSELEGRLLAILDPAVSRRGVSRAAGLATVAGALALILPLAAMRPAAEQPRDPFAVAIADAVARETPAVPEVPATPEVPVVETVPTIGHVDSLYSQLNRVAASLSVMMDSSQLAPRASQPARAGSPAAVVTTTSAPGGCTFRGDGGRRARRGGGGRSETTMSRNDDDGNCFVIGRSGRIVFTDDESDVQSIEPGGYLTIIERRRAGGVTRRMDFDPDGRGGVERTYWVDDEEQALDDEGRRWLASVLPNVVRESADPAIRAVRFLNRGGPDAVLEEARQIASDETKAGYFAVLFGAAERDARLMDRLTTEISRSIASDATKGRLLTELGRRTTGDVTAQTDVVEASETIASDSERRRLLSSLAGDGASRDVLVRVARSAAHIASDHEKGAILLELAGRYVDDDELRRELLRLAGTIASDSEKGRVLLALLSRGSLGTRARAELLAVANTIASDSDKQSVLTRFAATDSLADEPVRRAFFSAARSIASDNSKQLVLTTLLKRRPSSAVAAECVRAARGIASDNGKANVLLAAAESGPLDESLRVLLLDVAETLASDSEYRRVAAALVR